MFTANDARALNQRHLDERIERAVRQSVGAGAHIRVHHDDPWINSIEQELELRGFKNIQVPDIVLAGDVWFEW